MVEVMKLIATAFNRCHALTAALSAPDPAAGPCHQLHLCFEFPGSTGAGPQKSHAFTATLSPSILQQATADPRVHRKLLDTHGQIWVSLLWGHCSFLLGPGVHKLLFVPSKSLFPQSCVSSGGSMVRLMATSSKRTSFIIPTTVGRNP